MTIPPLQTQSQHKAGRHFPTVILGSPTRTCTKNAWQLLGLTCRLTPVPTIYDCCLHCTFNLTFLKKGGLGRVIESIKVVAQESARHRSWLKNPRATIVVALNFARH
eukprot:1146199-Pelagomonas_calceolata.AAC.7